MKFRSWNRIVLTLTLAVVLVAFGCRSDVDRRLGQNTRRELELGRESARLWLNSDRITAITEPEAVAVGYLERLRLGLGSPFRLADYALSDPRLTDSLRTRVAFALLDRVLNSNAYEIDPVVLDRAGTIGVRVWPGLGVRHLALIEQTIEDAEQPRVAEAAIRMAYTIAAGEGLVSEEAPALAAAVAALRVDRALAREDAALLLASADETQPTTVLLRQWRAERRFQVEQPRLGLLAEREELTAIHTAQRMVDALRALGLENASRGLPRVNRAQAAVEGEVDWQKPSRRGLPAEVVQRLEEAEARLAAPPQTPIVIAARQIAREAPSLLWLNPEQCEARARFGQRAVNEESFVVEQMRLPLESAHDAAPARAALQAAVALRAYAQESVWFPGMDGPSHRELLDKYGLAEITFERSVRMQWRPYYRRMLASALEDLQRVLPALDLRGLRIHFGSTPDDADALAIHEPGKRRLLLPPLTSAGTLAHEMAHDVDWQMALRRYHVRGDYATDRAARDRNDRLSAQVRNLASASMTARAPEARLSAHARRPAEIFARNVDWYVAVSLARAGRRNGYLSSVQDELITGYGTVQAPDISGAAGDALMAILNELAPVYREQRVAFRALYGRNRSARAYDLVRRIVEAPRPATVSGSFQDELEPLRNARQATLLALDGPACAPALRVPSELQTARRQLVLLTAEARARGLALRHLQRTAFGRYHLQLVRQLYRGPAPVALDSISAAVVAPLASAVHALSEDLTTAAGTPFDLYPSRYCGATLAPEALLTPTIFPGAP